MNLPLTRNAIIFVGIVAAGATPSWAQSYSATILEDPVPQAYAWFGRAVTGVGDIDGDGSNDVLIGAHRHDYLGFIAVGRAYVFSGASQTLLYNLGPHQGGEAAAGSSDEGNFGWAVAGVGDVDNDGAPDFAVGQRHGFRPGQPLRGGRVLVYSGATGTVVRALDNPWPHDDDVRGVPEFGSSVAGIADLDGDGVPDILVAANTQYANSNVFQGQVSVFSGVNGSLIRPLPHPERQAFAFFGVAVTGLGDVNGDAVPDIAVGASGQNVGGELSPGRAYVLSGTNGAVLRALDSPIPNRYGLFGFAIATVRDLNGDGVSEILVGAPFEDVAGKQDQGRAYLFSGADGLLLQTLTNPMPLSRARFGESVADAGDVNGDGFSDLLVGAPGEYMFSAPSIQGSAYLFSGHDGHLLRSLDHPTPEATARYGQSVAGVGDVNGDGGPDLLVGATYQNVGVNSVQGRAFLFKSILRYHFAGVCRTYPLRCQDQPALEPGVLLLQCGIRRCLIFDPIPKNCTIKFSCPGCEEGGLCPPWYTLFLDGLGDAWTVSIIDPQGRPVPHERSTASGGGMAISFRPAKEFYVEGRIGDYVLVFRMEANGKPGSRYRIPMRLERSNRPYRASER